MSDQQTSQHSHSAIETNLQPVLTDQPTVNDTLGFESYVNAVANFLMDRVVKPPLALSIEAEWGSDKSSFMLQLECKVRSRGARTVWFNAWRHDKEEALWAMPTEVLDLAEAYLVGLRDFSVPLGHEPTQVAAEFRLRLRHAVLLSRSVERRRCVAKRGIIQPTRDI